MNVTQFVLMVTYTTVGHMTSFTMSTKNVESYITESHASLPTIDSILHLEQTSTRSAFYTTIDTTL
jgi:hypothetical protein